MDQAQTKMIDTKIILLSLSTAAVATLLVHISPQITLDAQLYYTGDYARTIFANYSSTDLKSYFHTELLDLLFILLYTWTLMTALGRMCKWRIIAFYIPILLALLDLTETIAVIFILLNLISQQNLNWLGYVTFLKWIMGALMFATYTLVALTTGIINFKKARSSHS